MSNLFKNKGCHGEALEPCAGERVSLEEDQ